MPVDRLICLSALRIEDVSLTAMMLPESLWRLPQLRTLELVNLPGVSSLPEHIPATAKLQSLHIASLGLTSLPDTIRWLSDLTSLQLFDVGPLQQLPQSIRQLSSLRDLQLNFRNRGRAGIALRRGLTTLKNIEIGGGREHPIDLGTFARFANIQALTISGVIQAASSLEYTPALPFCKSVIAGATSSSCRRALRTWASCENSRCATDGGKACPTSRAGYLP
jgi:hypothetical protein